MKVEILPVHRSDLQAIERFLAKEWTGEIDDPARSAMRERNWMPGNESFGLQLVVDGEIAGYLGASYSLRPVKGTMERFCAIAPWFVKDGYRTQSLRMLFKLLEQQDVTYVNYTPSRPMFKLFTGLGFKELDQVKLLMPPLLNLGGLRPGRGKLLTDPSEVRAALSGDDAKMFDDHVRTRCRQIAIVSGDRVCYLAAGRRMLRGLRFAEILHVSAPDLLAAQFERVVWLLCRHFRAVGVASDERLIAGARVRAFRYKLNSPGVYKSARVQRLEIDNLWSELAY
jgi:hypothetical protein